MDEIPIGDHSMKKNRTKAERLSDEEIPLFLGLRAVKVGARIKNPPHVETG